MSSKFEFQKQGNLKKELWGIEFTEEFLEVISRGIKSTPYNSLLSLAKALIKELFFSNRIIESRFKGLWTLIFFS